MRIYNIPTLWAVIPAALLSAALLAGWFLLYGVRV